MQKLLTLPAREPPQEGESLTSLLRRNAAAMGYEGLSHLLSLVAGDGKRPCHPDALSDRTYLDSLAVLLGLPADSLIQHTVHRWAPPLAFASAGSTPAILSTKETLRYFDLTRQWICVGCLEELPAYERLDWRLRAAPVCTRHHLWLVSACPACRRPLRSDRPDARHCRCGFQLRLVPDETASEEVQSSVTAVKNWLDGTTQFADNPPRQLLFSWLERVATAVVKVPVWMDRCREELRIPSAIDALAIAWIEAAGILREWPTRFETFLDLFQTIDKKTARKTGTSRAFGRLLREADQLERSGFSAPAELLRDYLLTRFNRGHLNTKVSLFRSQSRAQLTASRTWITQTEAARQLRVRVAAVTQFVKRGLLEGQILPAGARSMGVVSRASVTDLQNRLCQSASLPTAARQLEIERHCLVELIRAEILTGCVRTLGGWLIPRDAIDGVLESLEQFPVEEADAPTWLSIGKLARDLGPRGLTFLAIVQLLFDGRIRARRQAPSSGFAGLRVHVSDVARHMDLVVRKRDLESGYPLSRLARILFPDRPVKEIVLHKWIAAGLLKGRRTAKRWWIEASEVDRFRAEYCLAHEACARLGISRGTLARWESDRQITPVYSRQTHHRAGASVFRRSDVERLKARTKVA